MKKVLFAIIGIVASIGMMSAAFANFVDNEASTGNTFSAGSLDLTIDGLNGTNSVAFNQSNLAPGASGTATWTLANVGSIAGTLSMVATYTSDENTIVEPEGADTGDDDDGADLDGELAGQMTFTLTGGGLNVTGNLVAIVAALNAESEALAASGGSVAYALNWSLPTSADNTVMTDDITLSITFNLNQ